MMGVIAACSLNAETTETFTYNTTSTESNPNNEISINGGDNWGATQSSWVFSGGMSGSGNADTLYIGLDYSTNTGTATVDFTVTSYGASGIKQLSLYYQGVVSFDISNLSYLEQLYIHTNNLSVFDETKVPNQIKFLGAGYNSYSSIDVSNFSNLETLYVNNNTNLTSLDVSSNTNLEELYVSETSLTSLDISSNTKLRTLQAWLVSLSPTEIDNIYIQLDSHGLSNGSLSIDSGRTSASDTARANLIAKGWGISD